MMGPAITHAMSDGTGDSTWTIMPAKKALHSITHTGVIWLMLCSLPVTSRKLIPGFRPVPVPAPLSELTPPELKSRWYFDANRCAN
jgi:hypothetical protein